MDMIFSQSHCLCFLLFFSIFWVKNTFLTKSDNVWENLKISISSHGYQPLHAKKRLFLVIKSFCATSVRENAYPLGLPTWFCVTATFRDACVRTYVLKNLRNIITSNFQFFLHG